MLIQNVECAVSASCYSGGHVVAQCGAAPGPAEPSGDLPDAGEPVDAGGAGAGRLHAQGAQPHGQAAPGAPAVRGPNLHRQYTER